jgi:small basic protein (TIGR04137 family)
MSIHSSLRVSGAGSGQRNVWTRAERIAALKKSGRWKDGDKVVGLPKVRTGFKAKKKPKEAAAPGAGAPAAGAPAAGGAAAAAPAAAAPAKDAKAAAPAKDTKAAPAKK